MEEDRPDVIGGTAYPDSSHFWLRLHPYLREAVAELAVTVGLSPTSVWSAEQVAEFARELAGLGCFMFGVTWCRYSHPNLGILTKYDTFRPAIEEGSMYTADGLAGPCGFGPDALRRYVIGPAWGILLSAAHVRALGGSDEVHAAAPVAAVRDAGKGLWLEATALPNDDDVLEHLVDVARFLDPLIPSVDDVHAINGSDPAIGSGRSQPNPPPRTRSWRRDADTPEVEVEVGSAEYELSFTVEFDRRVEQTERDQIDELLAEWFDDGLEGRFGGSFHDGYRGTWTTTGVITNADWGSQPVDPGAAVSDLARRLFGWGVESSTAPPKIVIGYRSF